MRYRSVYFLLIVTLMASAVQAQKTYIRMGDMCYKQFDYKTALQWYEKVTKKDSGDLHVRQNTADCYRHLNDWVNAEPWYAMLAKDPAADALDKMYYAEALRANKKYADAKAAYVNYIAAAPSDSSARERLTGLDKVSDLANDRGNYTIKNLAINSPFSDFGPSFYTDGQIFFCSNREPLGRIRIKDKWTGVNFLQIYIGKPDNKGNITTSDLMHGRSPNGRYHEGPATYNEKLKELYVTRSNYKKARAYTSSDQTVNLKLYKMAYISAENKWADTLTEAVSFNDKEYSVEHPALSPDGQTLYFASDKPGGYGGVDLYKSIRDQSGNWAAPVNLGSAINTSGDDMFPYIANDGTLYFASNGHMGLGGLDVYSSTPTKDGWSSPVNLGFPINTNSDDFGYIIDKENKSGYFVSNRPGGKGDDDIYKFERISIEINGLVYDAKTNDPIDSAKVTMYEVTDVKGNTMVGRDGRFSFVASPMRQYKFVATRAGYLPDSVTIETSNVPATVKIPLTRKVEEIKLEVLVIDSKTKEPIDMADVKLTNVSTGKQEPQQTGKDGKVFYKLDPGTAYKLEGAKETNDPNQKYLSVTDTLSTIGISGAALMQKTLALQKVNKGVAIKLENIYFDVDKSYIRPDAAIELNKLVKIMQDNPGLQIELSSHTDCRATYNYNMALSKMRALSAVQYLASQGIDRGRMVSAGYGESRLVNKCACEGKVVVPCTEEQHQQNRRTEFKILKF